MNIEISYYQDVLKHDPSDPSLDVVIARNKLFKNDIDTKDITVVSWYYNKKGERIKSKCQIIHKDLGVLVVNTPYDIMRERKANKPITIKGFKK